MTATTTATSAPQMQRADESLREMTIEGKEWFREEARQNAVV